MDRKHEEYRFVLFQLRSIISDRQSAAQPDNSNVTAVDQFIEDLFGVKKFVYNISHTSNSNEAIRIIDSVGLDYLFSIFANRICFNAVTDMVEMLKDLKKINKKIRKKQIKPKERQRLEKQKRQIEKKYRSLLKVFRRRLGIRNYGASGKRLYRGVDQMINLGDYFDEYYDNSRSFFGFDDFDIFSSPYDDYGYMYDERDFEEDLHDTSLFDDYLANGRVRRRERRRASQQSSEIANMQKQLQQIMMYIQGQQSMQPYPNMIDPNPIVTPTVTYNGTNPQPMEVQAPSNVITYFKNDEEYELDITMHPLEQAATLFFADDGDMETVQNMYAILRDNGFTMQDMQKFIQENGWLPDDDDEPVEEGENPNRWDVRESSYDMLNGGEDPDSQPESKGSSKPAEEQTDTKTASVEELIEELNNAQPVSVKPEEE